jgi:RNA exonuclease 1
MISSIGAIKKRVAPDSASHASVGTEADIVARAKLKTAVDSLDLKPQHIEPHIMSLDDLQKWGYFISIPPGPGGDEPSQEGKPATCERCNQVYVVRKDPDMTECSYHPIKAYFKNISGGLVLY